MQLTDQQWAQLHESVEGTGTQDGYVLTFAEFNAVVQLGVELAMANLVPSTEPGLLAANFLLNKPQRSN